MKNLFIKTGFKKSAFTLAEILIVLMVIGLMSILTVSIIVPIVDSNQWRASYSKIFTSLRNLYESERFVGSFSSVTATKEAMFKMMQRCFLVNSYAPVKDDGVLYKKDEYVSESGLPTGSLGYDYWIITDENAAYRILSQGTDCDLRAEINNETTVAGASEKACYTLVVDVNGLSRGPNTLGEQNIAASEEMGLIKNDRFYIYVGSDGATAGNKTNFVTGRIVAGMK